MYGEERKYDAVPDERAPEDRRRLWETASGLQAVDGLEVSDYANGLAEGYIAGEYDSRTLREQMEARYAGEATRQAEADIVSGRITGLLEAPTAGGASIAPETLKFIHRTLFEGCLEDPGWVGAWRKENISKPEPVLGGRSVEYGDWRLVPEMLAYDFGENESVDYGNMGQPENARDFSRFVARIWEIHPFREGNTRTIATFSQMYLARYGIEPGNDYFRDHSEWFRDALVRASYSKVAEGIEADGSFLELFFENVILDAGHDLAAIDLNLHGIRVGDTPYRPVAPRPGKDPGTPGGRV